MSEAVPERIAGGGPLLLLCDHASDHVPADINLGIDPALLGKHIAVDIGAGPLTRALAARLRCPALLGTVSRLVIDLHRQADHPGLIPPVSDGHVIPGNADPDRAGRIARFHGPYHRAIDAEVRATRPKLILAIHSFTPRLEAGNAPQRRWEVGILYNRDTRAARLALDWLRAQGLTVGDQEPYSGRVLNATLNRHAEANGIPSCAIEVRNDLIRDAAGVARWADLLAAMARALAAGLALELAPAA